MPTSRAFAFNSGSTISETSQVGNLAIAKGPDIDSLSYAGLEWWMGPDEDLGYVIGYQAVNQPTQIIDKTAKVQFWRSPVKTEQSFIQLARYVSNFTQTFSTGLEACTWLNNNGYWTSFNNLALDSYEGVSAAFSLRRLRSSYSGAAIRVQRSSDSTQQDIGFVENELDTASLATFVGAGTGEVVTWYDQSGNGYNVIKVGTIGGPRIRITGTNQTLNGKIALNFNGSQTIWSNNVGYTNIIPSGGQFIAFGVGNATDTNTRLLFHLGGSNPHAQVIRRNGNPLEAIAYNSGGTDYTDIGSVDVSTSQFIACTERKTSSIEIWTNNASNGATAAGTSFRGTLPMPIIGSFNPNAPSFTWLGNIQEVIMFAVDPAVQTTYRNNITTIINSYYNTY